MAYHIVFNESLRPGSILSMYQDALWSNFQALMQVNNPEKQQLYQIGRSQLPYFHYVFWVTQCECVNYVLFTFLYLYIYIYVLAMFPNI